MFKIDYCNRVYSLNVYKGSNYVVSTYPLFRCLSDSLFYIMRMNIKDNFSEEEKENIAQVIYRFCRSCEVTGIKIQGKENLPNFTNHIFMFE